MSDDVVIITKEQAHEIIEALKKAIKDIRWTHGPGSTDLEESALAILVNSEKP